MEEKPKRWFRFRLRTLLLVVLPLCAVTAWWVSYSREWIRKRHAMLPPPPAMLERVRVVPSWSSQSARAPGGLWMFGEVGYSALTIYTNLPTPGPTPEEVKLLFPEATVTTGEVMGLGALYMR